MIPVLEGWSWEYVEGGVLLVPLDNPALGAIRYLERLAPVLPVADLVTQQLACDPHFIVDSFGAPEDLVTLEGEFASLVTVRGSIDGQRVQRDLGYILGDDCYARVGACATTPAVFDRFTDTVRRLVLASRQMRGVRRRRYRYAPPPGWRPLERGYETTWYAPDGSACIDVRPALPADFGVAEPPVDLEGASPGTVIEHREGPFPISTRARLSGVRYRAVLSQAGSSVHREINCLQDDRYVYTAQLDAVAAGVHHDTFQALVASIEPLPGGRRTAAAAEALLEHWSC